jgi:Novel STAND NTPase 1
VEHRTHPTGGQLGEGARWLQGRPYQGLAPFDEDQAEVFYRRERATADLVGTLGEHLSGLGLVVVTGASGAGKSSLLRAGLLPALARGSLSTQSTGWPRLLLTPTRAPLGELATHLAALAGADPAAVCGSLAEHPDRAHLLAYQAVPADAEHRQAPATSAGRGRLVVVDQFEELFTHDQGRDGSPEEQQGRAGERSAFITALHAMASTPCGPDRQPPALVAIAVRADFLDRCAAYPPLTQALPGDASAALDRAVAAVLARLRKLARPRGHLGVVRGDDVSGHDPALAHLGDTAAFRLRDGEIFQITENNLFHGCVYNP